MPEVDAAFGERKENAALGKVVWLVSLPIHVAVVAAGATIVYHRAAHGS